ncbi:MAG: DUF3795 domain-containing protein [Phycisphaerales bacterium]|nr:DUF3795 domain-containing protein [Phycisphaerales bacterium]
MELGRCGYRCDICPARSDDPAVRQHLVDVWRAYYGHEHYTVDNVRCDGCLADGRLADVDCKIRPCVIEKGIPNCAHCDEFVCDTLRPFLTSRKWQFARHGDIPEADYHCMHQFDSIPRLLKIRRELGKDAGGLDWADLDDAEEEEQAS